MKGYIYIIRNKINNKVYIGQTTQTINVRFTNHKMASRTGEDTKFYRAMRKYGEENFYPEQLEEVEVKDLNDRERYWIKQYNSYYNGYNSTLGGDQPYRINYDEVLNLWNRGLSITEISNKMNNSKDAISRILKQGFNISEEEILKRGYDSNRTVSSEQVLNCWDNGLTPNQINKQIGSTTNTIKKILLENGITEKEWQLRIKNNNRDTNPIDVLNLWNQGLCLTEIANKLNITHTSVLRKQLNEQNITNEEIEKRRFTKTNQNAKPVVQLTLDNKYVATYPSGRQAEIQSGVAKASAINACCNHKPKAKTAGGYKWMFKTEYDTLNK